MNSHTFYKQWEGPVDLSNCAREPIHVPGAIQPHGVLLAISAKGRVLHASANAGQLGVTRKALLASASLDDLFDGASSAALRRGLAEPPGVPVLVADREGRAWHATMHRSVQGLGILELEDVEERPLALAEIRNALAGLRSSDSALDLCREMATQVQALTGYDRAMIYRFDADLHGEIIAEAVGDGFEIEYLGRHFPEADIPAQARRLYSRQLLRVIVDIDYQPAALEPSLTDAGEPLDLSDAHLRSVSPIHCDYLRHMGVRGTLTLSILVRGRLWGLVACHHYEPRTFGPISRDSVAFLTEVFTWQLDSTLRREELTARNRASELLADPVSSLQESEDLGASLFEQLPSLADFAHCDGAALVVRGEVRTWGSVPGSPYLERAVRFCRSNLDDGLFVTDRLASVLEDGDDLEGAGCGVAGVAAEGRTDPLVLLFRDERRRQITWGRDPTKKGVEVIDGIPRLSPLGSFGEFDRQVRQQSLPWTVSDLELLRELSSQLTRVQARHVDRLAERNKELLEANDAKDAFLAMLSHELRNPLNALVGWSALLNHGKVPAERQPEAFAAIHRNALAQKRLIDDMLDVTRIANGKLELRVEIVDLTEVVQAAMDAVKPDFDAKDIRVSSRLGESALVEGDFQRLQQVIWNLLTNAARYTPRSGHVTVRVHRSASWAVVEVQDDGIGMDPAEIPELFLRFRQGAVSLGQAGLGLGLSIVSGLVNLHDGRVSAHSEGKGLGSTFRVELPIALAKESRGPAAPPPAEPPSLDDTTVIAVDDQPDATALLAQLLSEAGATVQTYLDPVSALEALPEQPPENLVIISDINMEPFDGYTFARKLRERPPYARVPLIAVTAYAQAVDRVRVFRAGFSAHLAKPIDTEELLALVASLSGNL